MAAAFNLTAQLNLQGPGNIKAIVSNIQKQINGAKIKLNLDVNQNAAKSITSISTRLNNLSKAAINANANITTLNQSLSTLATSFNSVNSNTTASVNNLAKTSKAASSAGKAIAESRTQIEEFGKQAGLAVKRFAAFSTVTAPIYALTNAVSDAFKQFVNFNQEIIRLSQVTGSSVGDLGSVSKEITRLSTSLGVASSDLLQVATTLAQAGLSAEDTRIALEALAKSALAPSFESLTDTTEGAIAVLRQFGIQASELDSALGSINAVAAAFAVEAGDIITAIQRTGGVFSAASRGVSEGTDALNEFIAIFTSVRATTRESAETIATGLRTIFTRIQRVKTIEQLREFGIELQDTEGKFVGLFEATKRLSEGLSRIDPRTTEFATISEELGGFRQIGKVIPLIQQFAVSEQALAVAQKGVKSTSKDALIAQQSLAVQFAKTRENFLALVREIGESTSFKAFVKVSLVLADSFINLGRALKPLLPLLLTFASIKAGGALTEYFSGFQKGLFGGRGGGGASSGGSSPTGGGGGGTGPTSTSAALSANTTSLNTLGKTLSILNQSILALNQNIVNSNSLLLNKPSQKFASGGLVPGTGNSDTVGAMLTPGEFVIRKKAVESIGAHNLAAMNSGGEVQRFEGGSPGGVRVPSGKGRGKKVRKGARGKFEHLNQSQLESLSTEEMIDYAKKQMYHIMTTGGSGMAIGKEFVEVPESRITPELAKDLIMGPNGKMGFEREIVAPFGSEKVAKSKKSEQQKRREKFFRSSRDLLTAAMQGIMAPGSALPKAQQDAIAPLLGMVASDYALGLSATPRLKSEEAPASSTILSSITEPLAQFRKSGGKTSLAGVIPKEVADKIRDAIPGYIESLQKENEKQKVGKARTALKYFDSFVGGGTTDVPGQATAFTETINQIIKNNLVRFASGGSVQKFANGGLSKEIMSGLSAAGSYEKYITKNMQSGDFLEFGMVGLIPGTKNTSNKIIDRDIGSTGKKARIFIGFLQGQNFKEQIEGNITKNLESVIVNTAKSFGSKLNSPIDPVIKKQVLEGAVLSSAAGSVFESALQMVGAPYIDKVESLKSMDFPLGLGPAAKLFGDTFPDHIPSDATRTIAGKGKGISDFLGQIERFLTAIDNQKFTKEAAAGKLPPIMSQDILGAENLLGRIEANTQGNFERAQTFNEIAQRFTLSGYSVPPIPFKGQLNKKRRDKLLQALMNNAELRNAVEAQGFNYGGLIQRFADGGGISSEDTVPALLTPGEFVFNKKAAQRIGYGTLNKLNKADKVQGFNKGGAVGVQRYAGGGIAEAMGGAPGVIAAITAVILPQIEQLADSFGKLDGQVGTFGSALGGAIREASSLTLSAGIGLRAVGAKETTIGIGQGVAAVGGLVGGALTEGSAKALTQALIKNTDKFGKFDKTLQNIANAPTEELRLEASKNLQNSFIELDSSVQNTKKNIDRLENLNIFGSAIKDIGLTILTGTTAIIALGNAANQAALAVQQNAAAAKLAAANNQLSQIAGAGVAVSGTAVPAALGFGTKLLGAFSKLIPVIGIATTVISVAVQLFSVFNTNLKKSTEQLDRVYKNLDEATKNNPAFATTNPNFRSNILVRAQELRAKGLTKEEQISEFGRTPTAKSMNELNLTFRTLLTSRLAQEGISFSDMESMQKLTNSMGADTAKFSKILQETSDEFIKAQFIRSQTETGEVSTDEAISKFNALGGVASERVRQIVENYIGAKNREIVALRELTIANNKFKLSLLSVDNILISFSSTLEILLSKTIDQFDSLDRQISLLGGEAIAPGGQALRQDISILNNLRGATQQQIDTAIGTVSQLISPQTVEQKDIFNQISAQIKASAVVQKELPIILREIQANPGQERVGERFSDILDKKLGESIRTAIGGDKKLTRDILDELGRNIESNISTGKEAVDTLPELARNNPAISQLLKSSEISQKTFIDILEASAKVQDKLAEQTKKYIDIQNQLIQSTTQRLQLESQEGNELNRILGKEVSLSDLNKPFDLAIKKLTADIGGTTEPALIAKELQKARDEVKVKEEQMMAKRGDAKQLAILTSQFNIASSKVVRFNKALVDLATSGEKTKNALDKIAEAQNKFKSRRQLLADLLIGAQNPETAEQQRQIMESVVAAGDNGNFRDKQQAALFLTEGVGLLEKMGANEKVISDLFNQALKTGILQNTTDIPPEVMAKILSFLQSGALGPGDKLAQSLPKFLSPLIASIFGDKAPLAQLFAAQEQRTTAGKFIEASTEEQLKLVTDGTISIFSNFNKDLQDILRKNIAIVQEMETDMAVRAATGVGSQKMGAIQGLATPLEKFLTRLESVSVPASEEAIQKAVEDFSKVAPSMTGAGGPALPGPVPLSNKAFTSDILTQFGKLQTAEEQLAFFEKLKKTIASKSRPGMTFQDPSKWFKMFRSGQPIPFEDINENIIFMMKIIQDGMAQEQQRIRQMQEQVPTKSVYGGYMPATPEEQKLMERRRERPRLPQTNIPANNEGAFLQPLSQSIDNFSSVAPSMIKPMETLAVNMELFTKSSDNLAGAFNRFMNEFNKELKASISHTYDGNVNLSFNDTLDVNLRNNNNRDAQLVQSVYDKLVPYIKSELDRKLS